MRSLTPILLATSIAIVVCPRPAAGQSISLPDRVILAGIELGTGLNLAVNTAINQTNWLHNDGSSLVLQYPGGEYTPAQGPANQAQTSGPQPNFGFVLFYAGTGAIAPFGTRPGQDLRGYQALTLRMRGSQTSTVEVAVKGATQADDGTETKVLVTVSPQWQTYYIPLSWFINVDLSQVYFLTELILSGSTPQEVQVSRIAYTSQSPAAGNVLPDFTYGGGWSTTLYFTNRSAAIVSFPVSFFGDGGNALTVSAPNDGSLTVGLTVQIAPQSTSVIVFPNAGATPITGYVLAMLPDDVVGRAELRFSSAGQSDQKVELPLLRTGAKSSTLIFDETKSVTTLFLLNPAASDASLSLSALDTGGRSLGQTSIFLPAGTKQTIIPRNLPGMTAMAGQQGSLQIDVSSGLVQSSGNVAVVALNSESGRLTSIPTADK